MTDFDPLWEHMAQRERARLDLSDLPSDNQQGVLVFAFEKLAARA